MQETTRPLERLTTALGVIMLLAAAFVLTRPGGLIRSQLETWRTAREMRLLVREEWQAIVAEGPVLGEQDRTQVVVEFIDYTCVYCRMFHRRTQSLLDDKKLRVVLRQRPNSRVPHARSASLAAICARSEGVFPAMHTYLLTDSAWIRTGDWEAVGRGAGVPSLRRWLDCLDSSSAERALARDSILALRAGVVGTPAFLTQSAELHLGLPSDSMIAGWLGEGME